MQVGNAITFHILDISNENTDSKAAMAVEHATRARTVLGSSLGHSALVSVVTDGRRKKQCVLRKCHSKKIDST